MCPEKWTQNGAGSRQIASFGSRVQPLILERMRARLSSQTQSPFINQVKTMRTLRWTSLVFSAVFAFALTGCAAALGAGYHSGTHHESYESGHYDHYNDTPEYRRIRRDANRYADLLDRELRLTGSQERNIERLLRDRARHLLRSTRPSRHYRVYPFPRNVRSRVVREWWNRTDQSIMRMLSHRQRAEYRRLTRSMDRHQGYSYDYDRDDRRNRGRGGRR